jgi:hypothetical protein
MSRSLGPMLCFQRRCSNSSSSFLVPRARARAHAWTDGKCCSHSGAIGDGIADLMEAGIVDNRHKA